MKVLILGGTQEARRLASELVAQGHDVTTSLAGRTREPVSPVGSVRSGGFGGVDGLAAHLVHEGTEVVIDATHPFAATISANAVEAAERARVSRLALWRTPWLRCEGDRWVSVRDVADAARTLPAEATVLLALGRQHLAPFATRADVDYLVRAIEPFELPFGCTLLLGRPSPDPAVEAEFLADRAVTHVVSRNSGGPGAYAKIEAARRLGLTVVMVDRPEPPPKPRYDSVDALLRALRLLAAVP